MTRIIPTQSVRQKEPNLRFTATERAYYTWLHDSCACCLTGSTPIHCAHTGPKAMARKAPLKTVLPLHHGLHIAEERNRRWFWEGAGIPDHLDFAERLFDLFETNQSPDDLLADMQARADRGFIATILRGAA